MKRRSPFLFVGIIPLLVGSCGTTNVVEKKLAVVAPSKPVQGAATSVSPSVPPVQPAEDPDAVYQMRQMRLLEWIEKAQRDCQRTKSTDAYLPEREGFLPDEITLVKTRCAESTEIGMRGDAWRKSMSSCADRFVQANGRGKHECRLVPKDVPDLPPELFDRHKAECTRSCAVAGADDVELNKERAQFVRCGDGTTSPTCRYGSMHSGCCAGHQGVIIGD